MNVFYIPEAKIGSIELNADESRHCVKVLRLREGDHVQLLNGRGSLFDAVIDNPDPKCCSLFISGIVSKSISRSACQLSIAIAPTKNMERFEWFAEKAAEIGIDRIIPLICKHSERKDIKPDRLEKILVSAMKQSGQLFLPELCKPTTFKELVHQSFSGEKMIAFCDAAQKTALKNAVTPGSNVLVLIGPEGDFDGEEIKIALEKGFTPVSLGESRLRTETAGIVACHTVCLINQL